MRIRKPTNPRIGRRATTGRRISPACWDRRILRSCWRCARAHRGSCWM